MSLSKMPRLFAWMLCATCFFASRGLSQPPNSPSPKSSPRATENAEKTEAPVPEEELTEEELKEREAYRAELDARVERFNEIRKKFEAAVLAQRSTYLRYVNGSKQDKKMLDQFREQRSEVRKLMDDLFIAGLDTMRMGFVEEPAQFVLTLIEHRFKHSIYNGSTAEGCSRFVSGGKRELYLFQTGFRSSIVGRNFDYARTLLEVLKSEEMTDLDRRLAYTLDTIEESWEVEKEIQKKEAEADNLPRVKLKTTQGDIVLELFINEAPSTVANFLTLVENQFYDDLDFHQVVGDLLAVSGDPTGLGSGGSGRFLKDENEVENARKGFRGSLVMAKVPIGDTGKFLPHSASSQFAILMVPIIEISDSQTVFGRVIEGMNTVCNLKRVNDKEDEKNEGKILVPPDRVLEATVIRRPETLPEIEFFDPSSLLNATMPSANASEESPDGLESEDPAQAPTEQTLPQ